MPSSYSDLLRLLKQTTGENSNTWGDLANSGFLELVEDSISGTAQIDLTAGTGGYTLSSNNGTSDEARCAILQFIGSPSVDKTITVPTTSKLYVVWNDLTTNKTLTMSTGAGSTTTLAQTKVDIIVVTEDGVKSLLSELLKSTNNLSDLSSASTARTNLGINTIATLTHSTDGTLAANSDALIPTQKAVKTYADTKATAAQGAKADTALQPAALTGANGATEVLLATYTPTAVATLDITSVLSSTYDFYTIEISDILPATDNSYLILLTSSNNGSSWDTSSGSYSYAIGFNNGISGFADVGSSSSTLIQLHNGGSNAANEGASIVLHLFSANSSAHKLTRWNGVFTTAAGSFYWFSGAGKRLSTSAINALQLKFSTGNIASGTVRVYGKRKV